MRKFYYLLAVVAVSAVALSSCSKEEDPKNENPFESMTVAKQNTALVVKHSGTKCPPCGGWGWTAWKDIIANNGNKAHYITAFDLNFVSQLFITDVAEDWKKGLSINSWPTFCANYAIQTKKNGSSIDVAGTKENIVTAVNAHEGGMVVANSALKTKMDGGTLTAYVKTKFFEEASGEYFLAVYVTEDEVMGTQSGHPDYPNPVAHEAVLRQAKDASGANLPSFGSAINAGGTVIAAGTEYQNEIKIAMDPTWNHAKLKTHVVIWKKSGTKYVFVNMAR